MRRRGPEAKEKVFFDPLLVVGPALVVEGNDALNWAAHVRHDEPDAGIKSSRMPLDLGYYPARLGPASGLICETRVLAKDGKPCAA